MKKFLTILIFFLFSYVFSFAQNYLNITNLTACGYYVNDIYIPPFGTDNIQSDPNNYFTTSKVTWEGAVNFPSPNSVYVDITIPYANSAGIGIFPPCLGSGIPYNVSWTQASPTSDALLLIF